MKRDDMLEFCFLLQLCVVYATPSLVAQSTSYADSEIVASAPTPAPQVRYDLRRRDGLDIGAISLTVDDNMCGWVDGNMRMSSRFERSWWLLMNSRHCI